VSTLEKMTGHTRLYRRGANYYHRCVVPKDILTSYGKVEETFSLKTKDYAQALKLVRQVAVTVDRRFDTHRIRLANLQGPQRENLSETQIAELADQYYRSLLDEDDETRLDGFVEIGLGDDGVKSYLGPLVEAPRRTFEEHEEANADSEASTRHDYARGIPDPFFLDEASDLLTWDDIDINLDPSSPSLSLLARSLQAATIKATQAIHKRNLGDVISTPPKPLNGSLSSSPILSDAVEKWATYKVKGGWSAKTENDFKHWMKGFIELLGDRPIDTYGKADIRVFKETLMELPANRQKIKETRNLSIQDALKEARRLSIPPMSAANVKKGMSRVRSFWEWAEANFDSIPVFSAASFAVASKSNPQEQRDPFSTSHLRSIFSSPLFLGCMSRSRNHKVGSYNMNATGKYWVPLLGLLTGARLNELCQLCPQDVSEVEGIWCLSIVDEGENQKIKNNASRRTVPIHSRLIELGLLNLVADRQRQETALLFPEFKINKYGYYSRSMSDFFSNHLEALDIKTKKTSFHSLRHSFISECRNAGVPMDHRKAITGHSEGGMGARYGSWKRSPSPLKDSIEKVSFEDVPFSGLPVYS
jgi:integrase